MQGDPDASVEPWHFRVRPATGTTFGYLAWCARTLDLGNGPLDVPLEFEGHFEFGDTEEEAMQRLKAMVLN